VTGSFVCIHARQPGGETTADLPRDLLATR
jgi:hypothetical protein